MEINLVENLSRVKNYRVGIYLGWEGDRVGNHAWGITEGGNLPDLETAWW